MTANLPTSQGNGAQLATRPRRKLCGMFTRRERWALSWRGWLIILVTSIFTFYLLLFRIHPFLAITDAVDTNVLVVEGWIHKYAIRAAVAEFRRGSYQRVLATGGPVEGTGGYVNDYQTEASVGAELLIKNGLPVELVETVPSRVMDRNRTYGSAVALRNWFRQRNLVPRSLNIVTEDVHARRSRLLFQEALGKAVNVGVIAIPNPDYDSRHWWQYSAGVKDVSSETIAYMYARLLFYPRESSRDENVISSNLVNFKR
jgi:uncharacterized SAM-binding protein YcdF (DUF218 family)